MNLMVAATVTDPVELNGYPDRLPTNFNTNLPAVFQTNSYFVTTNKTGVLIADSV